MAKSRGFFGIRRGRVGNMVYSRGIDGDQITREAPSQVANPKTRAQQVQRCTFAGVARYRALFKDIVDHSFESEPVKQGSLSEFQRVNLRRSQAAAYAVDGDPQGKFLPLSMFEMTDDRPVLTYAPVLMSSGTLASMAPAKAYAQSADVTTAILWVDQPIVFKAASASAVDVTMQDIMNHLDMQKGDMLTFVIGSSWRPELGCAWVRITRNDEDVVDTDLAVEANISKYLIVESGGNYGRGVVAGVSFYTDTNNPDSANTYRMLGIRLEGSESYQKNFITYGGFTCIHSRREDNKWKRSPQTLLPISEDASWCTDTAYREALTSWEIGYNLILNGGQESYFTGVVEGEGGGVKPRPVPPAPEQPSF